MRLNQKQWNAFVEFADTYHGPLSIGELFCDQFRERDNQVVTADDDAVWQIIYTKYVRDPRNKYFHNSTGD